MRQLTIINEQLIIIRINPAQLQIHDWQLLRLMSLDFCLCLVKSTLRQIDIWLLK